MTKTSGTSKNVAKKEEISPFYPLAFPRDNIQGFFYTGGTA